MQIWQPGYQVRDDGDYAVTFNPGNDRPFAIIDLSGDRGTALVIQSPEEADRLIRAAVKAKRLLDPPVTGCDCMADAPITDSERTCTEASPVTGAHCHRSGEHTTHRDTDGGTWTTDARLTELAAKS